MPDKAPGWAHLVAGVIAGGVPCGMLHPLDSRHTQNQNADAGCSGRTAAAVDEAHSLHDADQGGRGGILQRSCTGARRQLHRLGLLLVPLQRI